jgi:hypothetical protein
MGLWMSLKIFCCAVFAFEAFFPFPLWSYQVVTNSVFRPLEPLQGLAPMQDRRKVRPGDVRDHPAVVEVDVGLGVVRRPAHADQRARVGPEQAPQGIGRHGTGRDRVQGPTERRGRVDAEALDVRLGQGGPKDADVHQVAV